MKASKPQSQSSRRRTLLASLEYTIEDWNITIKTGYHGVLAQLIARNVDHQDLILVIPCIGGVECPLEEPAEPLSVLMFEEFYPVSVYYHASQNITYVLLDSPVFRERSKNEPFPEKIDEDTSAKFADSVESLSFYSAWNQCIAQIITRFSTDLYWITDLRGTLAPWYIRHRSIPCIFLFHDEGDFVYRQLGSTSDWSIIKYLLNLDMGAIIPNDGSGRPKPLRCFDLLFLAALYLRVYQAGQGFINSGIESTYDRKSHTHKTISQARINHINHLCFPDPSDIAAWAPGDHAPTFEIDRIAESQRASKLEELQQWAALKPSPDVDMLVFIGRWSMQTGIDIIVEVMPSILEEHPNVQLICVGPVVDQCGKTAARKLQHLHSRYPDRVFPKPEFTWLPPFVFTGSEFGLLPARIEPIGLAAIEYGKRGVLGIGSRVGAQGQTVCSVSMNGVLHHESGSNS